MDEKISMPLNKPSGNLYSWCFSWNPVGGECPHECCYCYVSNKIGPWIARMGNKKYYGPPRLIEKEFKIKLVVPDGFIIFVQSCGDLFAQDIPDAWIKRVFRRIRKFPETTFLLQTKNPARFFEYEGSIPKNCILGTTLETNRDIAVTKAPCVKERAYTFMMLSEERDFEGNKIHRLMLSLEPIMDFDLDTLVFWVQEIEPEFVSIGADSGNNNLPEPSPEKLAELIECLKKFTEVRLKPNLERLLK